MSSIDDYTVTMSNWNFPYFVWSYVEGDIITGFLRGDLYTFAQAANSDKNPKL